MCTGESWIVNVLNTMLRRYSHESHLWYLKVKGRAGLSTSLSRSLCTPFTHLNASYSHHRWLAFDLPHRKIFDGLPFLHFLYQTPFSRLVQIKHHLNFVEKTSLDRNLSLHTDIFKTHSHSFVKYSTHLFEALLYKYSAFFPQTLGILHPFLVLPLGALLLPSWTLRSQPDTHHDSLPALVYSYCSAGSHAPQLPAYL